MKAFSPCSALFVVLLIPGNAAADASVIGYIKTVSDIAYIVDDGNTSRASQGSPVHIGSLIKTDEHGSAGLTLKDNTLLSIGPNTEFSIDAYQFAPEDDKLELSASLLKGTLQYISGVIAKLKPEAVSVKTPTGVIAVRGTRFLVKLED
ncbi:FecR domain-containing protein [Methylomonas sp. LL1]|uniref:FecR family protein n=1 Tax=Methylomonas sp. LL1 TaxID=2785785 RepID=UPI0018C3B0C3|nr:FecR family protein [Methylomonas sp. LL1]QPK64324.1 FecR domain-containing protein [Methylomonas sp. LL1]